MFRGLPLALILSLVAAGCIQAPEVQTAAVDPAGALGGRVVTFDASGLLPLHPDFVDVDVRISPVGWNGPEPTLGVLSDGTIFITAGGADKLARSTDHGMTWELITTGDPLRAPKTSLDPWMWVDPITDRIYNAPLYVVCTWATWSDDKGASWDFNPVMGCVEGIPAHDHQKITTGPPAEGVSTNGYENVVYYSYNSFRREGTWVQASFDGGRTFTFGQSVHPPSRCNSGVAGPVAVGPDGTAYSPKPTCEGIAIAVSKDSGATWTRSTVEDVGAVPALAHMTDAAVDLGNNAYATWNGEDGFAYITRTTDRGDTWSKPIRVSPPGVNSTVHNVITAGESGRVAVAYLGTRADTTKWEEKDAEAADDKAVWHLFLSITEDALAESPVWTTVQVTPDDDPVQIGPIWLSGGSNPSRNLLDFIDMVERDGRIYIGYADGCDACTKASESRRREATVAIMETGPSLLGGMLAPLTGLVEGAQAQPAQARAPALPLGLR
ncbi:MAG TPA: sialidase family protein [Candidatus Thermoplasmatota archaeon]|nr:sialidase family protein [Candidatus Thermoplasmatota archaeon]